MASVEGVSVGLLEEANAREIFSWLDEPVQSLHLDSLRNCDHHLIQRSQ